MLVCLSGLFKRVPTAAEEEPGCRSRTRSRTAFLWPEPCPLAQDRGQEEGSTVRVDLPSMPASAARADARLDAPVPTVDAVGPGLLVSKDLCSLFP